MCYCSALNLLCSAVVCVQLTDWADGALARRLGQSSVLGSYLDPLADKVRAHCAGHLGTVHWSAEGGAGCGSAFAPATPRPHCALVGTTQALVACVVGALAAKGLAPMWLAVLVVGRDVGLVVGMALHRWRSLGWRVRGVTASQFFATTGAAVREAGVDLFAVARDGAAPPPPTFRWQVRCAVPQVRAACP